MSIKIVRVFIKILSKKTSKILDILLVKFPAFYFTVFRHWMVAFSLKGSLPVVPLIISNSSFAAK